MDTTEGDGKQAPFVPFTKAERIQQLGQIDESIVSLLRIVGKSAQSIGTKDTQGDTAMDGSSTQSLDACQELINEFFRTLHSVDVRVKRQIWGLEEAGIIKLGKGDDEEETTKTKRKPRLEPDGDGKIGGLDAGYLNSRSNKVEREMEAELWKQAEGFLKSTLEKHQDS
ncbi:mediator complex, subunit Med11 [Pseudomassariella vexata]|uniref:Mediator of RNA polymerase II transcription subunit 11 n=1 Tax=Pseudomassariella vexata TaxID=1141098 RepID=A0A1Y2EJB2_9PEZI|nr:mediator complex, subunit Med11 [Pseudomassariella vexata]ORY71336.1 mediator complex, subunit Med11 [Pseudomassariella vexata]